MGGRAISGGARYAWSMSTSHPAAAPYAVLRVDRRKSKGMAAIEGKEIVYFSLTDYDKTVFENLPKGIKKIIVQSPEYQGVNSFSAPLGTKAEAGDAQDDVEVPF